MLSVYLNSHGWKLVNKGWLNNDGPDAGLMDHPNGGGCAFFNHEARFAALIAFDSSQVGQNDMLCYPERPMLVLDTHTPTVSVAQGETLKLAYTIQHIADPPGHAALGWTSSSSD